MRFLSAALALLLLGVASAIESQLQLSYPEFIQHKTHTFDVWINITSGVPGMHPQIAKSAMNMELNVYGNTGNEVFISITDVKTSNSVPSVGSLTDPVQMEHNTELEERLKIPIKATFENGKVKQYTLDGQETLESMKIKKTILRHLELHLDEKYLQSTGQQKWPITYKLSKKTSVGNYSSHYIIASSPYTDFPKDHDVINITRTDNFEVIPYLAYHTHHNFEEQGCPGVCKKDHVENRFGAGCPAEYEPYQTPMKKSFVQHHNLRKIEGTLVIDTIKTKETHLADIYDQNLEVTIESLIRYRDSEEESIEEPTGQKTYLDLHEGNHETDEEKINRYCKHTTAEQAVPIVRDTLNHITKIVHEGSVEGEAKNIGEKLILLQKALALLKHKDFDKIQKDDILTHELISQASDEEKIKRQLWLDNLPLIGTPDSISFLVSLIKRSINEAKLATISLWECKTILEALPMNILKPDRKTIQDLSELLEILHPRSTKGYGMYYSAAYMAVARVIRNMCAVSNGIPESEKDSKANYLQMILRENDDDYKNIGCPKLEAKQFIKNIEEKMKRNVDDLKRIIHIEALSQTGLKAVIPTLKTVVEGHVPKASPSYRDFVRTVAINALHNLVGKHPEQIRSIVLPIFSNKTEAPKIRTAAFSVFIRSYPTMGDLQNVAEQTWHEPSIEVGSYVTSTLETFGNSSIPCDQLTARRIKKVLPQVKRFFVGKQHAQNVLQTIFDEVRGFGIENRFEFTPSNESFIPSTIYTALGYNADSLRDVFFKVALTSQGFNTFNLWDSYFKKDVPKSIPKSTESEIFIKQMKMINRASESWKFTIYDKLFYSMSYYYMDEKEYRNDNILELLQEHLKNYFKFEGSNIHGHLVKVFMPSSYQSKAFAQSLPYPVQYEMRNPMLISVRLDIKKQTNGYSVDINPSYYHSMLYTNQMLNLGDCKHVGVYHEKKMAVTYPIKISVSEENGKYSLTYSFPQLPKKIFSYHSEAGTFASKFNLEVQPTPTEKRTIETIPTLFVRNNTFGIPGLPVFASSVLTEDIKLGNEELPRSKYHAIYQMIKDFLNAGWRRKSIDITRTLDETWKTQTEVKLHFSRKQEFVKNEVEEQPSDDSWMHGITFDNKDEHNHEKNERIIKETINSISHLRDTLSLIVVQEGSNSISKKANLNVAYKRTLGGQLHFFECNATAKILGTSLTVNTNGGALFFMRPNEFKYGDDYGKQTGIAFGTIRFNGNPRPYIVTGVSLRHIPLNRYIRRELHTTVPAEYFYPETHDECIRDVKKGNVHSVACIKAIREGAIFNKVNVHFGWFRELPTVVKEVLDIVDLAVKHTYFNHLSIHKQKNEKKSLGISFTYINKLTDKPVVDVLVTKPTEELRLRKVDSSFIQPVSSIYSMKDAYIQYHTNNTYPATCTLMKDSVRTYDLKTIRIRREDTCSYVLTTHCVRHKKFAVTVKIDPEDLQSKEVVAYIGNSILELKPATESKYEIQFDKKTYTVRHSQPIMLSDSEKIYAVTTKLSSKSNFIEIYADKAGIKLTYDGQNVKVQVHPRYKGELCGLCSEFDGEIVKELRGPNRCLFSHPNDFVNSCALGKCFKSKPVYKTICSNEDYKHADIEAQDEIDEAGKNKEYEPEVKRNKVLPKGEKICFSTTALPVCQSRDVTKEKEVKEVGFHCLPKSDSNARKLVTEAKRRKLGELETKEEDFKQQIEYPTLCRRH